MNLKKNIMLITSIIIMTLAFTFMMMNLFIYMEISLLSMFMIQMKISMNLDWLSLIFMSTVLFISSMIIKFSVSYIPPNEHKMFMYMLIMFVLSMMILILSNNIVFMLLGWDGLGLSSYILVVYYQNASSSSSGSITILSNRIGDIMILMTIALMFLMFNWNINMNKFFSMSMMMMMMIAALSKSAQFPFSAWLPAAMSAPTPISALVHSSTLVTAGVYMMLRTMNYEHPNMMFMLMLMSSMTAIYASMSAMWEQDLKKIIALSTLSQMAMMMFSISINSINIAYFHLISHALFKSMMFLCAGTLIHSFMYQDMRHMGSMIKNMPLTLSMLGISNMSLMGIPFMSGFFSKDSILENMIYSKFTLILSTIMILSIMMTSLYSTRLMILSSKFILKSKPDMTLFTNKNLENPTIMMALFSIIFGTMYMWLYLPFQNFLIPNMMKIYLLFMIIISLMLIMMLNFKSKIYNLLGKSAISLWFIHMMSSNTMFKTNLYSNQISKNDKMWQEMYGPTKSFNLISMVSKFPNKMLYTSMCMIMIIMMVPLLFMM